MSSLKILVITGEASPGHEARNVSVVGELRRRGHEVRHAGPGQALAAAGFLSSTFSPNFAEEHDWARNDLRLFSDWAELNQEIEWADTVVLSVAKHYEEAGTYAKSRGKVVVQQYDVGALHYWNYHPHWALARGAWDQERLAALHQRPATEIVITGCVQFDALATLAPMGRASFFEKYRLDPEKKLAVYLPTTPASHCASAKTTYRSVCDTVGRLPGWQVMIKPHPREYARCKQEHNYQDTSRSTWEQVAPGVAWAEPADKYDCLRQADVILSQGSGSFFETALLRKPLLYVDRVDLILGNSGITREQVKEHLSKRLFTGMERRIFHHLGPLAGQVAQIHDPFIRRILEDFETWAANLFPTGHPEFIGGDCWLEELADILQSQTYQPSEEIDYNDYVRHYCFREDGLAYRRVVDEVESASRKFSRRPSWWKRLGGRE